MNNRQQQRESPVGQLKYGTAFCLAGAWLLCCLPAAAIGGESPGTAAERAFARDLLRELVEIDTTPANGCTRAAEAMAARLRSAGFPDTDVSLAGPSPDRQNLVVRLRGRGAAKPILLIAHLDVVDAPREGWSSDPFQLTERDGFFYGRGVTDMKSGVASVVATLIRLRAEGFVPERDIVVALTADEETGSANGVAWLLTERRESMDVAFCLNLDCGGGQIEGGKRLRFTVQTSEKAYLSFQAETTSPGATAPCRGGQCDLPPGRRSHGCRSGISFRSTRRRAYFARLSQIENGPISPIWRRWPRLPDLAAAQRVAATSIFTTR
jgi:hypothetical protein